MLVQGLGQGHGVNAFGFAGHRVSVGGSVTARRSMEAAVGGEWGHGCGPINLSLREQLTRLG